MQGQKTGDPKGPPSGSTPFLAPTEPKKPKMANKAQNQDFHNQSIDTNLLSYHEKFQPDWPKNG